MDTNKNKKDSQSSTKQTVLSVIGAVLCIILIPILIINITLIVKSYTKSDSVPSVAGYFPMIVLTDSMKDEIKGGDLIICHTIEPSEIKKGDIISFFDPEGSGTSIVTHRVTEIVNDNGLCFRTKGDANNAEDKALVPAENVAGIYIKDIPGAGNIAMFMQTTPGLIICVVCPLLLLIAYDVIRSKHYEKTQKQDMTALLEELEALKAEKESGKKDE